MHCSDARFGRRERQAEGRVQPRNTATAARFVPEMEKTLGLYDGFDGKCGNQLLAGKVAGAGRYRQLATLLADDRLWVNSASKVARNSSVELAEVTGQRALANDCGGRGPTYSAAKIYRSLLANGKPVASMTVSRATSTTIRRMHFLSWRRPLPTRIQGVSPCERRSCS